MTSAELIHDLIFAVIIMIPVLWVLPRALETAFINAMVFLNQNMEEVEEGDIVFTFEDEDEEA